MDAYQARALSINSSSVEEKKRSSNSKHTPLSSSLDSRLNLRLENNYASLINNTLDHPELNDREEETSFNSELVEKSTSDEEEITAVKKELVQPVKELDRNCKCGEHEGRELLDIYLAISPELVYKSLFTDCDFSRRCWVNRKIKNTLISEWSGGGGEGVDKTRTFSYTIDIGALGKANNVENQRLLEFDPVNCIVLESTSSTSNVPYSDSFQVYNRFCITKYAGNACRFRIHSRVNYTKSINYFVKSFIEKNTFSNLKDNYAYWKRNLADIEQEIGSVGIVGGQGAEESVVNTIQKKIKVEKNIKKKNLMSVISPATMKDQDSGLNEAAAIDYTESNSSKHLVRILVLMFLLVCILNIILYVKLNRAHSIISLAQTSPSSYFSQSDSDINFSLDKKKEKALRSLILSASNNFKQIKIAIDQLEYDLNEYDNI